MNRRREGWTEDSRKIDETQDQSEEARSSIAAGRDIFVSAESYCVEHRPDISPFGRRGNIGDDRAARTTPSGSTTEDVNNLSIEPPPPPPPPPPCLTPLRAARSSPLFILSPLVKEKKNEEGNNSSSHFATLVDACRVRPRYQYPAIREFQRV